MMAAAQMQSRQYQMYTPQSNSPASVASSQGPEQRGHVYSQPPQVPPGMYYSNYQMNHIQPAPFPQHPTQSTQPQHQMMTPPQPAIPSHHPQPPMSHQSAPTHGPPMANSPRPQTKLEAGVPRPSETNTLQRSPTGPLTSKHHTPTSAAQNGGAGHSNQPGSTGGNANAAPGPIPATTPLVVRQDNNGVQWIAFEYSRDRVKMEYTIRCDVESVNVDKLERSFKEANCVYPRAFCEKDKYTGNRFTYETECNTVGWSLAELNKCLREKRGLIQRAVDSWRNSNQDSRLRSRRVRRMNKMNTRKTNPTQPNHPTGAREGAAPHGASNPLIAAVQQRPLPPSMNPAAVAGQMHHHHAADPHGSASSGADGINMNGHYDPHRPPSAQQPPPPPAKPHPSESPTQIRPANVFQGYPAYPIPPHAGTVSVAPPLQNAMEPHLTSHPATTIPTSTEMTAAVPSGSTTRLASSPSPTIPPRDLSTLWSELPERMQKRKFINVADPEGTPNKVRVNLDLRDVKLVDVVDDFRDRNSVYPRSYFPHQMRLSSREKRQKRLEGRFLDQDDEETEQGNGMGIGRTLVKVPTVEGEAQVPVPRLGRRVGEDEEMLNTLGYRIAWKSGKHFDQRPLLLQRS
ncbi:MAG: hypothetical protein Q9217_006982, partial [Psora testacea]